MEDAEIVALYLARQEAAIAESERKYGAYCCSIAQRILDCREDIQETLNDTWLRAWNAIPPEAPTALRPYFARITRNLAIDRWRKRNTEKRGGQMTLALEELSELSGGTPLPQELVAIQSFLSGCSQNQRNVFLRRYFYFESTEEIARRYAMRESNVLNLLSRTKKKLKVYLQKEGFLP